MFKVGDRVYIDGTQEEGTIKDIHGPTIYVRVSTIDGGHEVRRYVAEDLRLDPSYSKPTNMRDKSKYGEHEYLE